MTTEAEAAVAGVGWRVDAALAADRRLVRLVAARRGLYARSDLPAARYHAQVRRLWQEVADHMGWSVAEVRRKWSHLRNSYSRHLRNSVLGARTSRGRAVSRWHLADDLAFLRDHMATDTRALTQAPSLLTLNLAESAGEAGVGAGAGAAGTESWVGFAESWGGSAESRGGSVGGWAGSMDGDAEEGFGAEENSSYFQFFRGLHEEYLELSPRRQRAWRRGCLRLLHAELDAADSDDEADADAHSEAEAELHQHDVKPLKVEIVEHPLPEHEQPVPEQQ